MTTTYSQVGALGLLLLGVLILGLFVPFYCYEGEGHTAFDLSLSELLPRLQAGDILLSATQTSHVSSRRLSNNIRRIGTHNNMYNHVSVVVNWQGEWCVFDALSDRSLVPFMKHTTPDFHTLPHRPDRPVTGLIPIREFLTHRPGHYAYRAIRQPLDNDRLLQSIAKIERSAQHHTSNITKWIQQLFRPAQPIDLQDLTCSEAIGYLWQDLGFQHDKIYKGMAFFPFIEPHSAVLQDRIYRLGPLLSQP